jgi:hypothetical protein
VENGIQRQCFDPAVGRIVTSYCFDEAREDQQDSVERHLLECDACWEIFQRLDAAVRTLRLDRSVKTRFAPAEVVSQLGFSGRLDRAFGGHAAVVLVLAGLYGIEWAIGLWSELGYSYDRFGSLAWALSGPVAAWVAASLIISLWIDVRAARAGRHDGLLRSVAFALVTQGIATAVLVSVLPAEFTIQASFQTRTASAGYFKDVMNISCRSCSSCTRRSTQWCGYSESFSRSVRRSS